MVAEAGECVLWPMRREQEMKAGWEELRGKLGASKWCCINRCSAQNRSFVPYIGALVSIAFKTG